MYFELLRMSNMVIDLLYCYCSNSESDESGNESDSISTSTAELGDQSEKNIEVVTEHSSSGDTRQRAISLLDRLRAPRKSEFGIENGGLLPRLLLIFRHVENASVRVQTRRHHRQLQ